MGCISAKARSHHDHRRRSPGSLNPDRHNGGLKSSFVCGKRLLEPRRQSVQATLKRHQRNPKGDHGEHDNQEHRPPRRTIPNPLRDHDFWPWRQNGDDAPVHERPQENRQNEQPPVEAEKAAQDDDGFRHVGQLRIEVPEDLLELGHNFTQSYA